MKLKTLNKKMIDTKFRVRANDFTYFDVNYIKQKNNGIEELCKCLDYNVICFSYNKAINMMEIRIDCETV